MSQNTHHEIEFSLHNKINMFKITIFMDFNIIVFKHNRVMEETIFVHSFYVSVKFFEMLSEGVCQYFGINQIGKIEINLKLSLRMFTF
jgi:hypothetical protein